MIVVSIHQQIVNGVFFYFHAIRRDVILPIDLKRQLPQIRIKALQM